MILLEHFASLLPPPNTAMEGNNDSDALRGVYRRMTVISDTMSWSVLEKPEFVPFDEDLEEQQGIDVKGDMPFTDFGYKSAPNLEHPLNGQPAFERPPHQSNVDSSSARGDGGDYDVKTLYSIGTTVDLDYAQYYIIELSKDIYSRLCRFVDAKNLIVLSEVLPDAP